jgi:hypothetical protein
MGLGDDWSLIIEKFTRAAMSLASDIERFRYDFGEVLDAARRHDGGSEVTYKVSLKLRSMNLEGTTEELARILGLDSW